MDTQEIMQKAIENRKFAVANNIANNIEGEETVESLMSKGFEVYPAEAIQAFDKQLAKAFDSGELTKDELSKANTDKRQLQPRTVTTEDGGKATVWVRPAEKKTE